MRVHILAKELNVSSKAILDKCGEWFTEGSHATTVETADRVDLDKVRVARRRRAAGADHESHDGGDVATLPAEGDIEAPEAEVITAPTLPEPSIAEPPLPSPPLTPKPRCFGARFHRRTR
jgi:hypothetical protein